MSENQPETPDPKRRTEASFDASTLRLPVTSDRDDAAARIAELVRRSNERQAGGEATQAPAPVSPPTQATPPPTQATQPPAQAMPPSGASQTGEQAPATAPVQSRHPEGEATQAMPPVGAPAGNDATQAMAPVNTPADNDATQAMAPVNTPADNDATQAMAPVSGPATQAIPPGSSGAPEVTPVAPLDLAATQRVAVPQQPAATPAQAASADDVVHSRSSRRPVPSWALVVGALVVVAALVWAFVGGGGSSSPAATAGNPGTNAGGAAPAGYQVRLSDTITDCAAHARGKVRASLEQDNCVKATRSVGTGTVNGRKVLFVVSRIEMPSAESASRIKAVLDGDGTGNINDLLREGKRFAGGPRRMPTSGYASVQSGQVVGVAEAGYLDGESSDSDPALRDAAAKVAESVGTH